MERLRRPLRARSPGPPDGTAPGRVPKQLGAATVSVRGPAPVEAPLCLRRRQQRVQCTRGRDFPRGTRGPYRAERVCRGQRCRRILQEGTGGSTRPKPASPTAAALLTGRPSVAAAPGASCFTCWRGGPRSSRGTDGLRCPCSIPWVQRPRWVPHSPGTTGPEWGSEKKTQGKREKRSSAHSSGPALRVRHSEFLPAPSNFSEGFLGCQGRWSPKAPCSPCEHGQGGRSTAWEAEWSWVGPRTGRSRQAVAVEHPLHAQRHSSLEQTK